jgi:hypothetical protein
VTLSLPREADLLHRNNLKVMLFRSVPSCYSVDFCNQSLGVFDSVLDFEENALAVVESDHVNDFAVLQEGNFLLQDFFDSGLVHIRMTVCPFVLLSKNAIYG